MPELPCSKFLWKQGQPDTLRRLGRCLKSTSTKARLQGRRKDRCKSWQLRLHLYPISAQNSIFYAPPVRLKLTVTVVSTSTRSPFQIYRLYFHCLTASNTD